MAGASVRAAAASDSALSATLCSLTAAGFSADLTANCDRLLNSLCGCLGLDTDGLGEAWLGWSAGGWRVSAGRVR